MKRKRRWGEEREKVERTEKNHEEWNWETKNERRNKIPLISFSEYIPHSRAMIPWGIRSEKVVMTTREDRRPLRLHTITTSRVPYCRKTNRSRREQQNEVVQSTKAATPLYVRKKGIATAVVVAGSWSCSSLNVIAFRGFVGEVKRYVGIPTIRSYYSAPD